MQCGVSILFSVQYKQQNTLIYLFIYLTFFKVGYTNKNTYVAMPAIYI